MAKKRRIPKGSQQGRPVSQKQREEIVQSYAICGNKSQVAREMQLSRPTVVKVLHEAETDTSLQVARARALEQIQGRMHGTAERIIESITPEDLESGLIRKFDDDGVLVSVKSYGPSLMQKITSAAILTDKLKVLQETKQMLTDGKHEGPMGMPLPQDVDEALKQIGDRVRRLRILDVQFDDKHPEVVDRVQEVAHRASLNEQAEDADYEELDFDNPGE